MQLPGPFINIGHSLIEDGYFIMNRNKLPKIWKDVTELNWIAFIPDTT